MSGVEQDGASSLSRDQQRLEPDVEQAGSSASGRSEQLDSLRIIAILGVLFDHGGVSPYFVPGQVGVRFFLLLSGFLITRTLEAYATGPWQQSAPAIRAFYAKRALRIWPLYYAILAVLLLTGEIESDEALIHGFFVTNFAQALQNHWQVPSWFLPHLWTLCVQEQFYLVWPLLFVAVRPAGRTAVLTVMLIVAVAFRLGMWLAGLETQVGFQTLPLASFDALATGALLAICHDRLRGYLTWPWRAAGCALALLLALVGLSDGFANSVLLPTLWLIPLGLLVLCAFDDRLGRFGAWLSWRPLVFLGRISLGIYLLHLPVALALVELTPISLRPLIEHRTWSAFAINTTVTLVVAATSWFVFEKPLQRLRRYLPYDRRAAVAAAAG